MWMHHIVQSSGALWKSRWVWKSRWLYESRGGLPGLPVPNCLCGRKATLNLNISSEHTRKHEAHPPWVKKKKKKKKKKRKEKRKKKSSVSIQTILILTGSQTPFWNPAPVIIDAFPSNTGLWTANPSSQMPCYRFEHYKTVLKPPVVGQANYTALRDKTFLTAVFVNQCTVLCTLLCEAGQVL